MTEQRTRDVTAPAPTPERSPWPALWALVIGFFMILVDTTIVSVANPAIKAALDPTTNNLDNVVWVTSAYLLAYAVPLLITGRLGDRFGPKRIYLIGLAIFTLASLGCGLSGSLEMLIVFRAIQGLGAALMTPQTMAVITRTFPPQRRGAAMGLWGATSGVAMLVGPLAGGLLVDGLGWEWIFFVNLPVGVIGFVLAWVLVPNLETHHHRFDLVGVVLSAVGLFLIVFGLQEGEHFDWAAWVWTMIAGGIVVMALFIWQQAKTRSEPLVPLALFRDRNFSVSNFTIATVGFTVTSMSLPLMFFVQLARGLTPTESALLLVPMAVAAGVLSPLTGRLLDRIDARVLLVPGLLLVAGSLFWYSSLMHPDTPDLDVPAALVPDGRRKLRHVGTAGHHGDAQPRAASGRRGRGHLQHDAHDRLGARLRRDRSLHAVASRGESAGRLERRRRLRHGAAARIRRRRLLERHGADDPVAGDRAADRRRRGAVHAASAAPHQALKRGRVLRPPVVCERRLRH